MTTGIDRVKKGMQWRWRAVHIWRAYGESGDM